MSYGCNSLWRTSLPLIEETSIFAPSPPFTLTKTVLTHPAPEHSSEIWAGTRTPIFETQTPITYPTNIPEPSVAPDYVLLSEENSSLYLFNLDTGVMQNIIPYPNPLTGNKHFSFLGWSKSGCELYIGPHWAVGGRLFTIDLKGNIREDITRFDEKNIQGAVLNVKISPGHDMVVYAIGAGVPSPSGYPSQDIEVMELFAPFRSYRLTQNSGGEDVTWSSNGQRLAFVEFDINQTEQVFISSLQGTEKRQITTFNNKSSRIINLNWSPDDNNIAIVVDENPDDPWNKIELIHLDGKIRTETVEIDGVPGVSGLWWQNKNVLGVYSNSIYWIDIDKKMITFTLDAEDVPGGYIGFPHQLGSSSIGFFSSEYFYIFNVETGLLEKKARLDRSILYGDWFSVPNTFRGLDLCVGQ